MTKKELIGNEKLRSVSQDSEFVSTSLYSLSEIFHCNTKICRYNVRGRIDDISKKESPFFIELTRNNGKEYLTAPKISLSRNFQNEIFNELLIEKQKKRKSNRQPVSLKCLAKLLYFSYGLTRKLPTEEFRAAPSVDALYPIEIYPIVFSIENLREGLYHYNVKKHLLETLREEPMKDKVVTSCINSKNLSDASVMFILTAMFKRVTFKYGDRGYRYVLLDAGHIIENTYLAARSMDIKITIIREFIDDEINDLIGIDGVNEAALFGIAVREQ
ncbi:MAG: SagB/ThcOx family dehydrogenase [Euryarchaeota archaeon]|nr:SagB/ThcOx family dehydrogenase [Euryarchaeota archaeon]